MDDPLRQAEGRLQRYWNVDGLHEIGVALILALTALWIWASDLSDLPRAWRGAFSASFPILLCGGMLAEGRIVKAIRGRLTYPRAGFAEFKKPTRGKLLRGVLLGAIVSMITATAIRADLDLHRWLVALIGIGMGAMLWQIGSRAGLTRFQAVGALVAALGCGIAAAGWAFELELVVFFSAAALAMAASGGVTLWRFLHT